MFLFFLQRPIIIKFPYHKNYYLPEKHCLFLFVPLFYSIYFPLSVVIWLSVENILSNESIVAAKKGGLKNKF